MAVGGRGASVTSPRELSRCYIECHNRHDLEGLLSLVDESISIRRAEVEPLVGVEAVRRRYLDDGDDHERVVVTVRRMIESESTAAVGIHVESGPPSNGHDDGVLVPDGRSTGRLVRCRLCSDEVLPSTESDDV